MESRSDPSPLSGNVKPFAIDVLDREERFAMAAYQGFIAGAKNFWRTDLYASVKQRAEPLANRDVAGIETEMADDKSYYLYSWLERRLQQMKYQGRWGLMTKAEAHAAELEKLVPESARREPGGVEPAPGYITDVDVHQHPGGLWSGIANAVAHEWYQTGTSFSGVGTDTMVDHYVGEIAKRCPADGKVVDVGCTLGRMTQAIKKRLPEADVEGIDVCQPAVQVARAKAAEAGVDVTFRTANGEAMPYADGSVDVVGSHWIFHELPRSAIHAFLDETARVLKSGGSTVIFDMHHAPGGTLGDWLHEGYAARNNEPFAPVYSATDMKAELKKRGFDQVDTWLFNPENAKLDWVEDLPARRTHINTVFVARKA